MNADLLNCKNGAIALINSTKPPPHRNGKQKGYIKILKEIWEVKGYEGLGLSSQNLRDQAARILKVDSGESSCGE